MKTTIFHGVVSGLSASIAALIYNYVYSVHMNVDFFLVINSTSIIVMSLLGCLLASFVYTAMNKRLKNADIWFNSLFLLVTLVSLYISFAIDLPPEITSSKELFIGLSVPLHLMPVIFWLASKPLFPRIDTTGKES